jgi:hypothetical protein
MFVSFKQDEIRTTAMYVFQSKRPTAHPTTVEEAWATSLTKQELGSCKHPGAATGCFIQEA